jgi:hypothetical protein
MQTGLIAAPAHPTFLPGLSITRSNGSVVLARIRSIPEFVLQAPASLPQPAWTNLGLTVTLTGDQNIVTNTIAGGPKFYRLAKPRFYC